MCAMRARHLSTVSRSGRERGEADLEPERIGTFIRPARLEDRSAMEPLEPAAQHRPVVLVEESLSDMYDTARIDPKQVPIVREVMDRAQRDSVDDRGYAARIPVIDDVCSLEKRRLAQPADGAPSCVCAKDSSAEAVLMQSEYGLARRIATHVRIGHEACVRHVGKWQTCFELDETARPVD
jgi:hypothetical protein